MFWKVYCFIIVLPLLISNSTAPPRILLSCSLGCINCTISTCHSCVNGSVLINNVCLPLCGDGIVVTGLEACDDRNHINGDGCDSTCNIESGYYCNGQPSTCQLSSCGDGIITGNEKCDDGNPTSSDGCSSTCQIEFNYICDFQPSICNATVCGDQKTAGNETCDDGNLVSGDGCEMMATFKAVMDVTTIVR